MRWGAVGKLLSRDVRGVGSALVSAGFGIAAGTAALAFFLALGFGVRRAVLGKVFVVDQIELQPKKGTDPGLLGLLTGATAPTIPPESIEALRTLKGVTHVYPKLRFSFPCSARGGAEVLGRDVGTSELIGDGIAPELVSQELSGRTFADPLAANAPRCVDDAGCGKGQFCDRPSGAADGQCSDPIPAIVSPYLIELFDKGIAPAHGLPPVARSAIERASQAIFTVRIGESVFGKAKMGAPRTVRARIIGISPRAIDLGVTLPLEVVRRYNREYAGAGAATNFSSVLVQVDDGARVSEVIRVGATLALEPKDTRARDVAVLITAITALLSLVAAVMLTLAASNIAGTFRVLSMSRRGEIGLYRALGASMFDIEQWFLSLAVGVGAIAGSTGVVFAFAIAKLADRLARTRLPDFPFKPDTFFAFPVSLWLGSIAIAVLFAVLGALGPARRVARIDPATALAGE